MRKFQCRNPLRLLITSPYKELLSDVYKIRQQIALLSALVIVLGIGLTVYFSRFASKPLKSLADDAVSIAHFEFDQGKKCNPRLLRSMIWRVLWII